MHRHIRRLYDHFSLPAMRSPERWYRWKTCSHVWMLDTSPCLTMPDQYLITDYVYLFFAHYCSLVQKGQVSLWSSKQNCERPIKTTAFMENITLKKDVCDTLQFNLQRFTQVSFTVLWQYGKTKLTEKMKIKENDQAVWIYSICSCMSMWWGWFVAPVWEIGPIFVIPMIRIFCSQRDLFWFLVIGELVSVPND